MYTYVHPYIHIYIRIYIYTHMYMYMYICIYKYVHIYIYTYIQCAAHRVRSLGMGMPPESQPTYVVENSDLDGLPTPLIESS